MGKIDYDGCKMEPIVGTIGGPQSCEDCIYYHDDRECMEDHMDDDFDEDENNQFLAYISSL